MTTHTDPQTRTHADAVRAERIEKMRSGSYVFDSGRVMLLVPHGLGPADASKVARERLGYDGELDIIAFRSAPVGVYITYEAA